MLSVVVCDDDLFVQVRCCGQKLPPVDADALTQCQQCGTLYEGVEIAELLDVAMGKIAALREELQGGGPS